MVFRLKALALALAFSVHVNAGTERTSEADEAGIKDPNEECKQYTYQPVEDARSKFPTLYEPAYIVDGDDEANALFDQISASIPDIQPKGTLAGDFSSVKYGDDDPDCWWTWSNCVQPKHDGVPADIASMPEPRTLGYGFDDGPNCSHNAFYDYLQENNQKATMFYIGSNVMDLPLEAQRGVQDGHEICIHTWSHHYMTAFDNKGAFAELYYSMQAVKLVSGVTPTCWRPPFGDVDDRVRAIAAGLNLTTMLWKYDSNDWMINEGEATVDEVDANYQNLIDELKKGTFDSEGAIILTHEIDNSTMSMAVKWYPTLVAAFDHIVPVGVGFNVTNPYPEGSVTFPNFDQYINRGSSDSASASGTPPGSGDSNTASNTRSDSATSSPEPSTQPSSENNDDAGGALSMSASFSLIFAMFSVSMLL